MPWTSNELDVPSAQVLEEFLVLNQEPITFLSNGAGVTTNAGQWTQQLLATLTGRASYGEEIVASKRAGYPFPRTCGVVFLSSC